jgi:hypothetical protein
MSRFILEGRVRAFLEQKFRTPLPSKKLVVGIASDGRHRFHEFDGASPDGRLVIEIKTNQLKSTPDNPHGRYFSAIKWALVGDLYMLERVEAKQKLLVLTDRPLFEIFSKDMDGMLPSNTHVERCEI